MNQWQKEGNEPDYRFSLANERTFLAWIRTALAIVAGAVLLHEFASHIRPPQAAGAVSIGLAVLATSLGVGAYLRWKHNEIAMRHARPLPESRLMLVLAVATVVLGAVTAFLIVFQ